MKPALPSLPQLDAVRIPRAALVDTSGFVFDRDGFAVADLTLDEIGQVAQLRPAPATPAGDWIAFPPLVEPHTHIDKAFLRARAPNPEHDFQGARAAIERDRASGWTHADARARMSRALQLAYGHGVVALRTHIDSQPDRLQPCWEVFRELRRDWAGRITLQAVASLGSGKLAGAHGDVLGRLCADVGALLGPVFYADSELPANVARAFSLAERYQLDLDVHIDEDNRGHADGLRAVLEQLDRRPFSGRINLSHLCSLSRCEPHEIDLLARRAAAHGLSVVGLPIANLHLQDRDRGDTPNWRGVTPINALARAGVDVVLGGDNSQDMFVPWGALDPLAVLRDGMLAAHLDEPLGDAVARVSNLAGAVIGLKDCGRIRAGADADLTLFCSPDPFAALSGDYRERLTVRKGRMVARRSVAAA
ncbi:MAG TPA: amidohydrolase family protein [Xanthomonadales bacterium]|nr:amidohydrolase family protein [Xanthomonadales bacterium]